jgi:hypothetical protein
MRAFAAQLIMIVVLSLCGIPQPVSASELPGDPCPITVVEARFTDRAQIDAFAEHVEPWRVDHRKGLLEVGVDVDGMRLLIDLGFVVEIDDERTAEICAPRTWLDGQTDGIPGYPCYRTVEETFQTALDLVAAFPDLATWIDVGDSWEKTTPGGADGYDMMVLKLTNSLLAGTPPSVGGGKPRLFITSAIHAREYTTAELMTRFAEHLLTNYGTDADATWLLDEHEIHLLLQTNPDGRKHAEAGLSWRKNTNENYCGVTSTSRGADLNRNFEFQWACCGGSSGDPCWDTYRGPSPTSEPETQTVQSYLQAIFPDQRDPDLGAAAPADATGVYIDVHSYSELVLWPWGFTANATGNGTALQTLGRKLAFFNGYEPDQAIGLYPTDGTTVDFGYGELGVASYVFELGTSFFQSCSAFESTIFPDNLQSLIYAAKIVRTPYLTPGGPEVVGVAASTTVVAPGEPLTIQATADDTRFNHAYGAEPTQNIASAAVLIDTPPWAAGATPLAMSATDGTFDSPTEAISAAIGTTGLATGRHTVFVQATDDSGSVGPVSAAFFWLLDPSTAAHIAGTVTSADTGDPLPATVSAGVFTTETNPGTGAYDLMLPEGTYDVTATADDHGSQTATSVIGTAGVTTPLDFSLTPYEIVFRDDVEDGNPGWIPESPWAITDEASSSPVHSWTDSPGGSYSNRRDDSLFSPVFDLTLVGGVVLEFSQIYDLESGYDFGRVEIRTEPGNWITVASFDGTQTSSWERVELELPALDHVRHARVRFRIDTDGSVTRDGWHIDDIVLRGFDELPSGMIFYGNFEDGGLGAWSASVR